MKKITNIQFLIIIIIVLACVIVINSKFIYAHPPLPTEFYGAFKYYNSNISSGTITAYANNTLCGTFTIVNSGFYGVLSCLGKDIQNPNDTGAIESQIILFKYNNIPTTANGDNTYDPGIYKFVNITFPEIICGDSFCDATETCVTCEFDCKPCNYTSNVTQNETGDATGNQSTPPGDSTSGSGTGTGSGSGAGAGAGSGAGTGSGSSGSGGAMSFGGSIPCIENWVCLNWSDCLIVEVRNRTCTDKNNCGTYLHYPKEIEECTYIGNCFDNLINCHHNSCEQGVDCGGPCEKRCGILEQPSSNMSVKIPIFEIPKKVCEKHIELFDPGLWYFVIIILLSIIIRIIYTRYRVSKLRNNDKLTPLNRARKIRSEERKTLLFTITLVFLTIVSLLYSYFFLLCPNDFFQYSWILALMILLVPLIVHSVMKRFEYSEIRHIDKSKKLDDVHYQNLVKMIEMENNILAEEENEIANKLYELSKKEDFMEILGKDQVIKDIYKNLIKLYSDYKDKKNPFNTEKDICDEINALEFDVSFKNAAEKHPDLKHIFDRLKKLYAQYEEKQKLYDKLDEIEKFDNSSKDSNTRNSKLKQ